MTASTKVAERVAKNSVAQVVAMASTIVSKLLITIVIGRLYGAERVGEFAVVMTLSLLFTFLASAGLNWSLIRETATHRDQIHRYAGNGFTLVFFTGSITIPLMIGTAVLLGYGDELLVAVGLVGLALIIDCLAQVLGAVFNGLERMELGAAIIIGQELAFLLIGGMVLLLGLPFIWLFVVYIPSRFVGLIIALFLYQRMFDQAFRPRFEFPFMQSLLRVSVPYAVNMALGPIYLRIDVLMLSFFQGSAAVGLYEAATAIFYRFNIVARMLNNSMMPLLAHEYEKRSSHFRPHVKAAAKYQIAIGMPLTVLCAVLGGQIITLFYGEDFASAGIVFSLLATIITLRFLDNLWAMMLTALDMQKHRSVIVALAAVVNIALNLYFIPRYGFMGAAITTILTEVCFAIGLYLALSSRIPRPMPWEVLVRPSIAVAVMGIALWLLVDLPLLALLLAAGSVYLVALVSLGTFSPEEWRVLMHISQIERLKKHLHQKSKVREPATSYKDGNEITR